MYDTDYHVALIENGTLKKWIEGWGLALPMAMTGFNYNWENSLDLVIVGAISATQSDGRHRSAESSWVKSIRPETKVIILLAIRL